VTDKYTTQPNHIVQIKTLIDTDIKTTNLSDSAAVHAAYLAGAAQTAVGG